jgi:hypothetical protein
LAEKKNCFFVVIVLHQKKLNTAARDAAAGGGSLLLSSLPIHDSSTLLQPQRFPCSSSLSLLFESNSNRVYPTATMAQPMSIVERMKKVGKTVVDAGAKTMLKVRSVDQL